MPSFILDRSIITLGTLSLIGVTIGSILIAILATRLRIFGIVGCGMLLSILALMGLAERIWGGSMGSYGWITGMLGLTIIIPLALLVCTITGVVSLIELVKVSPASRISVLASALVMTGCCCAFVYAVSRSPDIERMLSALKKPDNPNRLETIQLLSELRDAQIIEPMILILQNPDEQSFIRSAAVWTLGVQNGDPRIVPALIEAVAEDDQMIKEGAIFSLGRAACSSESGDKQQAFETLAPLLHDREEFVRRAAVQSIGCIEDRTVIALLISALQDESSLVTFHAHEGLLRMTGQHFDNNFEQWYEWFENTSQTP